ncbi:MAG: hypothetical protein GTO67_13295 [Gammaproteobacteria bacterium]|nr:hypothetical protein [Gammaproteobacteria bacterium]NIN39543.1 hypothetical protein [Gammaproteobacteria bacterium]NIO25100.1 hypothetical protein [Gammaproteobacteria bacterium]NIO65729.1 hypothetical protein [Gammaproteobacteria bacterium]NIP64618.1 hypothetical protein [Gammaproteobacteria bacterium]
MNDRNRIPVHRNRLLGRLLALNLLLFSSPLLPGWLALASDESGTRLVELCTGKGLRLVAVPVEDLPAALQSEDDERTPTDCAKCPLGKCPGSGFAPALLAGFGSTTTDVDDGAALSEQPPATIRVTLRPPTRAPPAVI